MILKYIFGNCARQYHQHSKSEDVVTLVGHTRAWALSGVPITLDGTPKVYFSKWVSEGSENGVRLVRGSLVGGEGGGGGQSDVVQNVVTG